MNKKILLCFLICQNSCHVDVPARHHVSLNIVANHYLKITLLSHPFMTKWCWTQHIVSQKVWFVECDIREMKSSAEVCIDSKYPVYNFGMWNHLFPLFQCSACLQILLMPEGSDFNLQTLWINTDWDEKIKKVVETIFVHPAVWSPPYCAGVIHFCLVLLVRAQ